MENLPQANKSLGQHWLTDTSMLNAIVSDADVQTGEQIVEIGPGTGTLTTALLEAGAHVVAVEFDTDLAKTLQETFPELKVHNQDILKYNFSEIQAPYKIVANIPYYLTSKLIRVISETSNPPELAVLLVQKEVAVRICAAPGDMSLLSVSAQYYWGCSLGIEVPAKYFTPPPKVDSQTVILKRRDKPLFGDIDEKQFFRIVKAGYSNRRKTLLNSLSGGLQIGKDETKQLLEEAGISPQARPQELSLQQWHDLYKSID